MVGNRLQQARKQAGLSQKQVAKLMGVFDVTVSRWETGTRGLSIKTLQKLAELYDVSEQWLISGESSLSDDALEEMSIQAARTNISIEDFDKLITLLQSLRQVVAEDATRERDWREGMPHG